MLIGCRNQKESLLHSNNNLKVLRICFYWIFYNNGPFLLLMVPANMKQALPIQLDWRDHFNHNRLHFEGHQSIHRDSIRHLYIYRPIRKTKAFRNQMLFKRDGMALDVTVEEINTKQDKPHNFWENITLVVDMKCLIIVQLNVFQKQQTFEGPAAWKGKHNLGTGGPAQLHQCPLVCYKSVGNQWLSLTSSMEGSFRPAAAMVCSRS